MGDSVDFDFRCVTSSLRYEYHGSLYPLDFVQRVTYEVSSVFTTTTVASCVIISQSAGRRVRYLSWLLDASVVIRNHFAEVERSGQIATSSGNSFEEELSWIAKSSSYIIPKDIYTMMKRKYDQF